ncbi:MAG: hypothetical protein ACKO5M_06770 [Vulcanococcus sp.]
MTNFQGGVSRRVTREQVLLWSPVILGAVLALAAGGLLLWPALQQLQRNQQQLDDLKEQKARIPMLRQQVLKQRENLEQAQQKERQILQLIAGSGDISTFMTQLGQEARKSGVQLDSYEPVTVVAPPPPPAAGAPPPAQPDPNQPPPPPADPLLGPGLQKTSILISARGSGLQLQDFLRRIERLSLLVVQSDLSLKHEAATAANGKPSPVGINSLKLNLTLYSKAPAPAQPAAPAAAPAKT